jgi:hypothetical protein
MTGGAAMSVATKSGTNNLRGSAFYFRNQDEFNARQGYFDPVKLDASTSIMGGTVGGPILKNRLFYFGGWERNLQNQSRFDQFTVPTEKMRNGDFSEVLAFNPAFRIYDPTTGNLVTGAGREAFPGAVIPANRISSIARQIQATYPAPNNAGTNNGLQNNYFAARSPEATRQLRREGELESHVGTPDLGQVLDDGRLGAGPVLPALRGGRRRRHAGLPRHHRQHLDAEPHVDPRRQRRFQHHEARVAGA